MADPRDKVHFCGRDLALLKRTRPQDFFQEALTLPFFGVARCGCKMVNRVLVDKKGLPCVHCACLLCDDPRRTAEESERGHCRNKMSTAVEVGQLRERNLITASYWHYCTGHAVISLHRSHRYRGGGEARRCEGQDRGSPRE